MATRIVSNIRRISYFKFWWLIFLLPVLHLAISYLSLSDVKKIEVLEDQVYALAPLTAVSAGILANDINWEVKKFSRNILPSDYLTSIDQLQGKLFLKDLPAGHPVSMSQLKLSNENLLAQRIPVGMRAVSVKVDITSAVEGWVSSGAIVDVLLIEKDRSIVVAERVKVVSAERSLESQAIKDSPNVPSTVTLLLTKEQCMAVSLASSKGKLSFALRNDEDLSDWLNHEYSVEDLSLTRGSSKVYGYAKIDQNSNYSLVDGTWVESSEDLSFVRKNSFE